MPDRKGLEEAKLEGKRQLSHTELEKKKKQKTKNKPNTSSFVFFLWIWFNKTGLPSWSTTDLQTPNTDGTLAWERLFLGQAQLHWGKKGFFCHDNFFTAETSCFNQSNRQLYRMVCTPSGAFQCLGDSFKTGLKVNIFPCIPGVFTIAWKKSGWGGRIGDGKSLRILEGTQLFQKQTKKL